VVVLGVVDIDVRFGHKVDHYFHLPMFGPSDGWWKVWFFLTNDVDAPLPVFMGNRPIPQVSWGYRVPKNDLHWLQPLCEVVQQLLCEGLMGVDLLQTFFTCRVQMLHQREMIMWIYPRPSCPDRLFSEELGNTEINTWINRVLAHGVDLNLGTSPNPLREGVDSP
jgi:hypothetical protein